MNIIELQKRTNEECSRLKTEMVEAVAAYRDVVNSQDSSKADIKRACTKAIRKMAAVIDQQVEMINGLIMSNQYMSELLTRDEPRPLS